MIDRGERVLVENLIVRLNFIYFNSVVPQIVEAAREVIVLICQFGFLAQNRLVGTREL